MMVCIATDMPSISNIAPLFCNVTTSKNLLTSSGPFRKTIETGMAQTLAELNLPTRDDITRIAERLTNIEMRLDDLDANLGRTSHE